MQLGKLRFKKKKKKGRQTPFTLMTQTTGAKFHLSAQLSVKEHRCNRPLPRTHTNIRCVVCFVFAVTDIEPSSCIYLFVSTELSIWLWFILPLAERERQREALQ